MKTKDLELLHQLLYNYKDKLLALMAIEIAKDQESEFTEEEQLFQILDELGAPKRKIIPRRGAESEMIVFLSPPDKSGYLQKRITRTGINLLGQDTKRQWTVMTSGFLHFFDSAIATKPLRSISLDELYVSIPEEAEISSAQGHCFNIHYYRMEHTVFATTLQDVLSWTDDIRNAKVKYARLETKSNNERLRAIETRVRNHTLGLKFLYDISLSPAFEHDKGSRIVSPSAAPSH